MVFIYHGVTEVSHHQIFWFLLRIRLPTYGLFIPHHSESLLVWTMWHIFQIWPQHVWPGTHYGSFGVCARQYIHWLRALNNCSCIHNPGVWSPPVKVLSFRSSQDSFAIWCLYLSLFTHCFTTVCLCATFVPSKEIYVSYIFSSPFRDLALLPYSLIFTFWSWIMLDL